MSTHTHFDRGKRLRIVLKDGSVLYKRFMERRGRYIEVTAIETGLVERIATNLLRAVSIHKVRS